MAGINTKVVHRSNAVSGNAYGTDFVYDEAMLTGRGVIGGLVAAGAAVGIAGFVGAAALSPTRNILERFIVPKAGEGPTPEQQRNGFYDIRLIGLTSAGQKLTVKVTGDRDPGYGSTAKILGEAAVCLALDIAKTDKAADFGHPQPCLVRLIHRLTQYAGLTFSLID